MLRSLFSGVSGMKANQVKMDVIGNNIANVSTTGFKSGRVNFKDMLSQTLQEASSPIENSKGGTNPQQVGLGVAVAGIDTNMNQGALQPTGRATDLTIEGNGFFVLYDGIETRYTRDGSFTLDANGELLTSEGYHVRGAMVEPQNSIFKFPSAPNDHKNLKIPFQADNWAVAGITIKPSDESSSQLLEGFKFKLENVDGILDPADPATITTDGKVKVSVDATNKIISIRGNFTDLDPTKRVSVTELQAQLKTEIQKITAYNKVDFVCAIPTGATVDSNVKSGNMTNALGDKLISFGIEKNGVIKGIYGDTTYVLGKIEIASFKNAPGLKKLGGNMYQKTSNSGDAEIGWPTTSGYGTVQQGLLEMSNVDLAEQFTDMIITSRAFQANSKTITTSDEMLQELINLKR